MTPNRCGGPERPRNVEMRAFKSGTIVWAAYLSRGRWQLEGGVYASLSLNSENLDGLNVVGGWAAHLSQ
jgi:hypothetical protein